MSAAVSNSKETNNQDDSLELQSSKTTVYKNLIILGAMNMLINSAIVPVNVLVSSRAGKTLGNITFALNQIFSCLFSLILVTVMTNSTSKKRVLLVGNVCLVGFAACNWYISYYTLIPGTVLFGVGLATTWIVSLMYVNKIARYYARSSYLNESGTISYFTGIFVAFSLGGFILGNGTSAGVLTLLKSDNDNYNNTAVFDGERNLTVCISDDSVLEGNSLAANVLGGTIVFYSLLALLIILLFLDNLESRQDYRINCGVFMFVMRQIRSDTVAIWRLATKRTTLASLPIFLTSGISLGFMFSSYTKVSVM